MAPLPAFRKRHMTGPDTVVIPEIMDAISAPKSDAAGQTRFERKRERIIDAATALINQRGVKGMTFVDVAQSVNLNTASVTYYFRRKEQLAAAALDDTLGRLEAMVLAAAKMSSPRERVAEYLRLNFDLQAAILLQTERPITVLSDMRALEDPARTELTLRYQGIFRNIRAFFGPVDDPQDKIRYNARAHVLTEILFWLPVWVSRYSLRDYPRLRARLFDLLSNGIALPGARWAPALLEEDCSEDEGDGKAAFLRAATRLINERGYRGASVKRIASELNVTKGSFYHHLEAKDDLVLECFRRSYGRVSLIQRAADAAGGSQWQRLSSAIAGLLHIQLKSEFALLRTTALQALPSDVRNDVLDRSNRMALRFAGTLIDGIAEGSIRAIDPIVASQAIMAMLNSANEMQNWARPMPENDAIAIYASTLCYGMFDD